MKLFSKAVAWSGLAAWIWVTGLAHASEQSVTLILVRSQALAAEAFDSLIEPYYELSDAKLIRRLGGTLDGFDLISVPRMQEARALSVLRSSPWVESVSRNGRVRGMVVERRASRERSLFDFSPERHAGVLWDRSGRGAVKPVRRPRPAEVTPPRTDSRLRHERAYSVRNTRAVEAWTIERGKSSVIAAVIDSGIDYNHEDLAFNLWQNPAPSAERDEMGYDFVHRDGLPWDDHKTAVRGHGTHVAGLLGAVGGNGVGISGVSQRVSLMVLKNLKHDNQGENIHGIEAIGYAADHGARVISASWGSYGGDETSPALMEAIRRVQDKGILYVAPAGNRGYDNDSDPKPVEPASFPLDNIIAVAATDLYDEKARISNYGLKSVDLGAPGFDVYSTKPDDRYQSLDGTSMSVPIVAGAVALLYAAHPDWDWKTIKRALLETVDPVPQLQGRTVSGGRLNVERALQWQVTK